MDIDSVDNCNICMDPYDCEKRPRTLPCGHRFCTACLNNSISHGRLLCPHCQRPHRASNANEFPISYSMEAVISELRKAKLGAIPKVQPGKSIHPRRSGSKWLEVFKDEKNSLRKLFGECEGMQLEMQKYKAFLYQRRAEHVEFIQKIQGWLNVNADIVKQIVAEEKCLTDALMEADELKQRAKGILKRYDSDSSTRDITGSEEIGRSFELLEEWKIRSRNQLPNDNVIKRSERVVREMTAALCMLTAGDNDAEVIAEGSFMLSSIRMDNVAMRN